MFVGFAKGAFCNGYDDNVSTVFASVRFWTQKLGTECHVPWVTNKNVGT